MKDKKHLLLKLLCFTFMLGSTAAGAAACKNKPTEPSIPEGYDKTFTDVGSYYADEGEARYTFELTDSTFTLKLGGQTIGGTYLFNGTTLRLVTTDGTIIEATYSDAAIKFTYNGMSYIFIKNVEYTVTFEMNGGSAQADVKVLNGKKLDEATLGTPTKGEEGEYAFFGWYKDKDFKNEYSFDQPVTKDLKLYARFVKLLGKEEFFVTLDGYEGEDFAGKTEGRLLGNLPALAAKDGAEFDGWWYSAYNDAAKLTAKMEKGAEVKENLILYPVWKTAAPNVSVTEKEIISTAIDGTVTIFCGEKQVAEGRITNGKYAYDFSKQLAGDYVITVKSKTEETKAYYKNKALARVSLFDVVVTEQGKSELHFNAVEGAEKYLITVACGTQGHLHTDTEVKDAAGNACTVFDFTDCDMREGGMTFVVKAEANGYLESVSATYNVNRKLETPASVTADGTTAKLSWTAVKHANYYLLTIDNGEAIRVNSTEYDIKGYGKGEHAFSITAVGKGWNNSDVANYTWTKETLAAPAKPTIVNGYTVTWVAVEGAQGYVLKIGEKEITINGTSYTLTDEDYTEGQTSYVVSVLAKGATAAENSLYSDTLTVTSGAMDGELKYENGTLSWNPGFGVTKYDVKVNDGAVTPVTGTSAKITLTKDGANVLYVRSYNAASVASAWVEKTVTAYTVSYNVGESEKKIADRYYAVGDGIDLPVTDFTGYGFGGWFDGMNGAGTEYKLKDGVLPKLTEEGNLTLYAKWNPNEYKAKFNAGAYSDDKLEDVTVKYTKAVPQLPVPKSNDTNMAFTGWYLGSVRIADEEGKGLVKWQYLEDQTLTAQWVEIFEYKYQKNLDSYYVSKPADGIKYLKMLTIPDTYKGKPVVRIESTVFEKCSWLETINIPSRINEIETVAFADCTALKAVNIIPTEGVTSPAFYSVDGVVFKNDDVLGKTLYYFPTAKTGNTKDGAETTEYTIPDGVTTISMESLKKRNIAKLYIPASVTTVQADAIAYMSALTEVRFLPAESGTAEKALTLGNGLFYYCSKLTTIELPARVQQFKIFSDTETNASYKQNMFASCTLLSKIYVTGAAADGQKAVYSSSEKGLLLSVDGTTLIYYPRGFRTLNDAVELPDSVTRIGDKAFYGNTIIKKFVVPAKIAYIGASAFEGCSNLATLEFLGAEGYDDLAIATRAFYGCRALTTLTIAENVRTIGAYAFGGCKDTNSAYLREVTVNSTGDVKFEDGAFADIKRDSSGISGGASYVEILNIGKGLKNVDISAVFGGTASKLVTVNVDRANDYYYQGEDGVIYDKNINEITQENSPTKILYYPVMKEGEYVVPSTVKEIGNNVFVSRKKLTKVKIGNNVTVIGDNAFRNCTGLKEVVWLPLAAGETENKLTIGAAAFYGCSNSELTTFTIPARVTSIGKECFAYCTKITSFVFPTEMSGEFVVGEMAFVDCDGLTQIKLPEKTVSVANGAFADCDNLVKVSFPASVERLGKWAEIKDTDGTTKYEFVSMDLFTKYYSAKYDSEWFIYASDKLAEIEVNANNDRYMSKDGMLYGKYKDEADASTKGDVPVRLYYCPTAKAGVVTLPLTLTEIYKTAFIKNSGVTEIRFEKGTLTGTFTIGEKAFFCASKLTTFKLPEGLSKIETGLFKNCTSLTTIEIPNTVTSIAAGAFENCTSLNSVVFAEGNDNVALTLEDGTNKSGTIGVFSYYYSDEDAGTVKSCTALTSIKFPKRLTKIGAFAFYHCDNLATIEFAENCDLKEIGDGAFGYTSLNMIKNGDETPQADENGIVTLRLPSKLTTIRKGAFQNGLVNAKTMLANTRMVIPASVTVFGEAKVYTSRDVYGVFYWTDVKEVVFEDNSQLTKVDKYALANAFKLKRVDFGANSALEELCDDALFNSQALESVDFGENSKLRTVGAEAFEQCYALKSISLPATVATIGQEAFNACTVLSSVTFETFTATDEGTGAVQGKSALTSIGANAFASSSITEFVFPSTKTELASNALGKEMFKNCKKLTTVTLSETVTNIANVFDLCGSISDVRVPMKTEEDGTQTPLGHFVSENGILYNVVQKDDGSKTRGGEIVYVLADVGAGENEGGTYKVADGVTKLNANVFAGKTSLKKVVLPASLQEIGEKAFVDCLNLEKVEFATNSVLSKIGASAFKNCVSLQSIALPKNENLTTLYAYTFYNCYSLTEVDLCNVVNIGENSSLSTSKGYVFAHCVNLSTINFKAMQIIQPYSFLNCKAVTSVSLEGMTVDKKLGEGAFAGCSNLEKVVLNSAITTLNQRTFANCSKLKSILPVGTQEGETPVVDLSKITTFNGSNGSHFQNCTEIQEVKLSTATSLTKLVKYMFDGCTNLAYVNKKNVGTVENPEYTSYLPDQLTYLAQYTFRNTGLRSVRMPNKVVCLGSSASDYYCKIYTPSSSYNSAVFDGCTQLTKVDLNNVIRIGPLAFRNCPLTDVAGTEDKDGNITGELDLSKVQAFGQGAFAGTGLKKVDLSAVWLENTSTSKTSPPMGFGGGAYDTSSLATKADSEGVFENCRQLKEVVFSSKTGKDTLGTSTTKRTAQVQLGKQMFKNCTALKKVKLPVSAALRTVLPDQVFYGCSALEEVDMNNTAPSAFGAYAFARCESLKAINLEKATATSIPAGMFDGCVKLASVKLPTENLENGTQRIIITSIGNYAFRDCASLLSKDDESKKATAFDFTKFVAFASGEYTKPASFTIGVSAFEGCTGLTEVKFNKIEVSGGYADYMPGQIKLGDSAFKDCTGLMKVDLSGCPDVEITMDKDNGDHSFYGHYGIGTAVFTGCTNLTSITMPNGVEEVKTAYFSNTGISYEFVNKNAVKENGFIYRVSEEEQETQEGTTKVTVKTIIGVLNEAVERISENGGVLTLAENERLAAGALNGITAIKKVVLPEGKTVIDANMFKGMQGLEEVVISAKTTSIGASAFEGSSVKKVTYAGAPADAAGGLLTTRFPETLTVIGEAAFKNTQLQKVVLPETLNANGTFDWSTGLIKGDVNKGFAVGQSSFAGSAVQSVVIEGSATYFADAWGGGAFRDCLQLVSVEFTADTAFMGKAMFAGCTALKQVKLPKNPYYHSSTSKTGYSFKGLAHSMFKDCTALTSITLPAGTQEIEDEAFAGCTSLSGVVLPEGLTKILTGAFNDCTSVKSIVIPETVTTVKFAFKNWTASQTIYLESRFGQAYNQWDSSSTLTGGYCSFMSKDGSSEKEVVNLCLAKIVWNYDKTAGTGESGKTEESGNVSESTNE